MAILLQWESGGQREKEGREREKENEGRKEGERGRKEGMKDQSGCDKRSTEDTGKDRYKPRQAPETLHSHIA